MQYIEQFLGFLQYGLAVLVVLFVLAIIGKSCMIVCLVTDDNELNSELIFLAPSIGAAVFSLPLVLIAHHGIGISSHVVWVSILVLTIPLMIRKGRTVKRNTFTRSWLILGIREWSVLPFAAMIGLVPYLQLFVKPGFLNGFGTSATWTNNDLGAYIQMATNVGKSGVRDAGLVTGWNAGLQASFDHPSAHTFFAGVARILNRQPYQVGIVIMATVIALILLAATFVIRRLSQAKGYSVLFISALVVINPPIVASVCNFFYPQLFSLSVVLGYIGTALIISRNSQKIWSSLLLALMTISVFLISVEIAAMMIPLAGLFVFLHSPRKFWKTLILRVVGIQTIAFLGCFALERDLFKSQLDVLTKLSNSGVAGWKANFVSPSMIFGLAPEQFSGPYTSGIRLIDALVLVALVAVCVVKVFQSRKNTLVASALISLIGLVLVATKKWGIDGYQTWKLITALTPLFMLLVVSLLLVTKSKGQAVSAVAVAMFTVGATFSWTAQVWKEGQSSSYINKDLAQILTLDRTSSQTGLNILLAPFFETMASSVISGAPSRMSSPNYYFFQGQEILYRCTVTTTDKLTLLPNHGPIIARRGNYVLVGTPVCD